MRLQKFLAMQTVNSRRKAEDLIASGAVAINGQVAHLGMCVNPMADSVSVNGATISNAPAMRRNHPLVLLMNKPRGYVCSHADKYNAETIFSLIPKEFCGKKLMFCGRLDKETEGMVIITDDGDFAQRITHPSCGVKKHYQVALSSPLPDKVARHLLRGIDSDGEFLKFDRIVAIGRGNMKNLVFEVVLSQGKKNEIHRALAHFGIFVKKLKRTRMGGLRLRGVATGRCRRLTEDEMEALLCEKI
ncbi:MAG: rRNA pseudouridine synthase [Puniceicoccales bacterium]|jgi:23S rRNA pseudouridine2605 synthase|nr:rRNA pseudouridine synthase [Puniceicoccales bacterium]